MKIQTVKAAGLTFDWNLWPRHYVGRLDSVNLRRIKKAIQAGNVMPPIVISDDHRIVDGFHRTKAVLSLFGNSGEIKAEIRHYKNDAELFLDAGRLNNHGMQLTDIDRIHFIIRARELKIPAREYAPVLGIGQDEIDDYFAKRSAKTAEGEDIPLPGGAINLAGKTLNKAEEEFARHTNANLPVAHAGMLIRSLKANAIPWNERAIKVFSELYELLGKALK